MDRERGGERSVKSYRRGALDHRGASETTRDYNAQAWYRHWHCNKAALEGSSAGSCGRFLRPATPYPGRESLKRGLTWAFAGPWAGPQIHTATITCHVKTAPAHNMQATPSHLHFPLSPWLGVHFPLAVIVDTVTLLIPLPLIAATMHDDCSHDACALCLPRSFARGGARVKSMTFRADSGGRPSKIAATGTSGHRHKLPK